MAQEADLESYLKKNNEKYFKIYNDIKKSSQGIWDKPRLQWYTDHGEEHSGRIVSLLNRLCAGLLFDSEKRQPEYGLNPTEVFLLLSSVWLHDIGMQDLSDLNGLTIDEMGEKAWNDVRERHPQQSYKIIMDHAAGRRKVNEFRIGIHPDSEFQFHPVLALISKGHGSSYYEEVIKFFKERTFDIEGKGINIRGDLLTSLLLIADEIDLHHSRSAIMGNYPLSKISKLHHYRHHYVQNVDVVSGHDDRPETNKTIRITFAFPDGSEEWSTNLVKWIVVKLEKESDRTIDSISKGFNGRFVWAKPLIDYKIEKALPYEKEDMEKDVQHLLKAEVQRVIDWKELTKNLSVRFHERNGGVVGIGAQKEHGVDLCVNIIETLFRAAMIGRNGEGEDAASHKRMAILNFGEPCKYFDMNDVIMGIGEQLGIDISDIMIDKAPRSPQDKWDSLYSNIKGKNSFYLIILQHFYEATFAIQSGVMSELIMNCEESNQNLIFVVNCSPELLPSHAFSCILPHEFEEKHFYDYFIESGISRENAEIKSRQLIEILKQKPLSITECVNFANILCK